jgi:hypothetical protein
MPSSSELPATYQVRFVEKTVASLHTCTGQRVSPETYASFEGIRLWKARRTLGKRCWKSDGVDENGPELKVRTSSSGKISEGRADF